MLKKVIEKINAIVPIYAWLPLLIAVSWNMLVYFGTRPLTTSLRHYDVTTRVDSYVPFLPWTIIIYFACYIFWVANYIISARVGRKECYHFLCAEIFGKTICLLFFIFFPTTNVRPIPGSRTIWDTAMSYLYMIDAPDNLFPSIHCFVSWMCCVGIRGKKVPKWYQAASILMAFSVFFSTLTTKQHVFVDVVGGVLLAELSYYIVGRTKLYRPFGRIMDRFRARILYLTGRLT